MHRAVGFRPERYDVSQAVLVVMFQTYWRFQSMGALLFLNQKASCSGLGSDTWSTGWGFCGVLRCLCAHIGTQRQIIATITFINPLTPNDLYISRTTPLTSKRCILYIYSTNVGIEYFKHALYSPFLFSSKCSLFHNNANMFGSCIIHILYTGCAEIKKKNNSCAKGLNGVWRRKDL